jgi:hypothetical protein
MKIQIKNAFQNFKLTFSNWRNLSLAIIIAMLFFVLNVFFLNAKVFFYGFNNGFISGITFIYEMILGFHQVVPFQTLVTTVSISVLFGILFTLVLCKTEFAKSTEAKKTGIIASIGLFLGILAPGCAACGVGLLSLIGLGAAVAVLPYNGLEISIVAILIMVYSIYHFSLHVNSCSMKPVKKKITKKSKKKK